MVDLFGGAIEASVPSTWRDVSQVRQVPDNQEVFQDFTEDTGAVLVIEILEYQNNIENKDACSFFLKDLADSNEALSSRIIEASRMLLDLQVENIHDEVRTTWLPILSIPPSLTTDTKQCCACISRGYQQLHTSGGKTEEYLSTNRISDNAHYIDIEICVLRLPVVRTDLLITVTTPTSQQQQQGADSTDQYGFLFQQILKTFKIKDWSLFAN